MFATQSGQLHSVPPYQCVPGTFFFVRVQKKIFKHQWREDTKKPMLHHAELRQETRAVRYLLSLAWISVTGDEYNQAHVVSSFTSYKVNFSLPG